MKGNKSTDSYVFDASALLTLWSDEEGADSVESILRSEAHIYVSFMSYMEGRYRIWKNADRRESEEFSKYVGPLPVEKVNVTDEIFERAIEIKATNNFSVCDSWIVATAIATGSILVHKDPEFEQVKAFVKLRSLPYKLLTKKRGKN